MYYGMVGYEPWRDAVSPVRALFGDDGGLLRHDDSGRLLSLAASGSASGNAFIHVEEDAVVFGEAQIHNRAEMARALGDAALSTATDAALVLACWRRWGEGAPDRLIGDFAFFVHDLRGGGVFGARDPSGVVPCWYAATPQGLVVASAPGPVLDTPGPGFEPDEEAVAAFLQGGIGGRARTLTRGLLRLAPGDSLMVGPGGEGAAPAPRVATWWRPDRIEVDTALDPETTARRLEELLHRAVIDRIPEEGHVGVHVSGGLDSTFIALTAARELRRRGRPSPDGFSWQDEPDRAAREGGDGSGDCSGEGEHGRVLEAARLAEISVRFRPVAAEDILACAALDPFRRPLDMLDHELPVMRAAREAGVGVMLSGWGGDEGATFNGRELYPFLLRTLRWRTLARAARQDDRPLAFLHRAALRPLLGRWLERLGLRQSGQGRRRAGRPSMQTPHFRDRMAAPERPVLPFDPKGMQRWLLGNGHIVDRIESWAIAGEERGLRYRYPMLDRRLLEFALTIPIEHFRSPQWNRLPMRRALDRIGAPGIAWAYAKNEPERVARSMAGLREACAILHGRIEGGEELRNGQWIDHAAFRAALAAMAATIPDETGTPPSRPKGFGRAMALAIAPGG